MPSRQITFLMYHELELPGRPLCNSEPGYVRYIVHEAAFRSQMNWLKQNAWQGLSVGQALSYPDGKTVALTFDDGSETDLITAAPLLKELGFNATFYVTTGFLNGPGYLSSPQLRELAQMGLEIGCHSMTHPYLNDLNDAELQREMGDARKKLEDITGARVDHFSCPGGRYDQRTLALARTLGYRSLATSRVQVNTPTTDCFLLGRAVVMRSTRDQTFHELCLGHGLWKMRLANSARTSLRNVLGNTVYDRIRTRALRS